MPGQLSFAVGHEVRPAQGMTVAYDSVIGFRPDEALHRFLMNTPRKLEVAKKDIRLSGVMVEVDETTGRAVSIARIHEKLGE